MHVLFCGKNSSKKLNISFQFSLRRVSTLFAKDGSGLGIKINGTYNGVLGLLHQEVKLEIIFKNEKLTLFFFFAY